MTRLAGYSFTDDCRWALAAARREAQRLGHKSVDTEHILLALATEGGTGAARALTSLGVDPSALRARAELAALRGGPRAAPRGRSSRDIEYTRAGKKVLELAMREAPRLGHANVGTEHLLLGILGEGRGLGATVLEELGVGLEPARTAVAGDSGRDLRSSFSVTIADSSDRSVYEQIIAQIQEGVATGRLQPGDRLPAVRQLADQLEIAPGTVARAYAELERLSVVITAGARGTRVAMRGTPSVPANERPEMLVGLLRPVAVAGFHLGASAGELREALEIAMRPIFGRPDAA